MYGLSFLHSQKIFHGNVKAVNSVMCDQCIPGLSHFHQSNILISDQGTALLADGCLAALIDATSAFSTGSNLGSKDSGFRYAIRWTAPEIIGDEDSLCLATTHSDVWSVGCVILVSSMCATYGTSTPVSHKLSL